ncbi:hypothetical protein C8F01DRAFT_1367386 [Mycena amicta]|nr:hypothetical protein C8F01DRAFT_1367386 [Mycena amicta]
MPLHLLDLPEEVLQTCFLHLPLHDLLSCIHTGNRQLSSVIGHSIEIGYQMQLEMAGVHEDPDTPSTVPIVNRVAQILIRERCWLGAHPTSYCPLEIGANSVAWMFDLSADGIVVPDMPEFMVAGIQLGAPLPTRLKYARTAVTPQEWRVIFSGKTFIDFVVADEENDLLVVVTYGPSSNQPAQVSLDLELLQFSTGEPHPEAAASSIHICDLPLADEIPESTSSVVGSTVALWLEEDSAGMLHLFDWKVGRAVIHPFACGALAGVFLTPDILIVPNETENRLDVFRIPLLGPEPVTLSSANTDFIAFQLPPLRPGLSIIPVSFMTSYQPMPPGDDAIRAQSSPSMIPEELTGECIEEEPSILGPVVRFRPVHEESLIVIVYKTGSEDDGDHDQLHAFVLRRAPLLNVFGWAVLDSRLPPSPTPAPRFPDDNRSLANPLRALTRNPTLCRRPTGSRTYCTRFLDTQSGFMTCSGQRIVSMAERPDQWEPVGVPLKILDFNRWTVDQVRLGLRAAPSDGSGDPREAPSLNDSNITDAGTGMIAHNWRVMGIVPERFGSVKLESGATARIINARPTPPLLPLTPSQTAQEELIVQPKSFSAFTEPPIYSDLAYVEIESKELYDYHVVHMKDSNVLGIRFNEQDDIAAMEVLHFGRSSSSSLRPLLSCAFSLSYTL